jgi:hypothetical protein
MTVKVARARLGHSRAFSLRADPRETQEMVKVAHARAFAVFGGTCRRAIDDTMSTAAGAVFLGRNRAFNRRFLQLCSHDLVEPPPVPSGTGRFAAHVGRKRGRGACTPAAGWEKGQALNPVGFARDTIFQPRLPIRGPVPTPIDTLSARRSASVATPAVSRAAQRGRAVVASVRLHEPLLDRPLRALLPPQVGRTGGPPAPVAPTGGPLPPATRP